MTTQAAGLILAGGQARRMGGGDKTLLPLGGRPLVGHVVARLAPQVGDIAINANGDPDRFAALDLPVLPDTIGGFAGPLAGVLTGMRWAASLPGVDLVATVAGDTPFFPVNLIERLRQDRPQGGIALAASDGNRHPVFGLWPVALADDLQAFLEEGTTGKVMVFVARHPWTEVAFDGDPDPFFNINTPDDLARAEAMDALV